jgi:hypothetical protein
MKVSEKSLELNIGAELLGLMRNDLGMSKAYLRGLTQTEEKEEGADFFVQLDPMTRVFAFQFKAALGRLEGTPYRYTLKREQHAMLAGLAEASTPGSVFYVFPFYVTPEKLHEDIPNLAQATWLLDVKSMPTEDVFGSQVTKVIRCESGVAEVNPAYKLGTLREMPRLQLSGIPAPGFSDWYRQERVRHERRTRRNPWLVRGLRVAVVLP